MNSRKRSTIIKKIGIVLFCLIIITIGTNFIFHFLFDAVYQKIALESIGIGALIYIKDFGYPPKTIEDMLSRGYLERYSENVVSIPGHQSLHWRYVNKMQFNFPSKAGDYECKNGKLVDKKTGEERYLIKIFPRTNWYIDLGEINCWIWERWDKLEKGQIIQEDWYKTKIIKKENYPTTKRSIKEK
jgi:hypothetical protein